MMDTARGHVGPFRAGGPLGWTFAVGVVALIGALVCVAAFVAYGLAGSFPLCPDERGLTLTLVAPAVAAGACIAVSALRSPFARAAASLGGAILAGGATWWIVARVFAVHCVR